MINIKQIGSLFLETGVLVLGDISKLRNLGKEEASAARVFEYLPSKNRFVFGKDFYRFTDILAEEVSANELISTGKLKELPPENPSKVSKENLLFSLEEAGFRTVLYSNEIGDKAVGILLPSEANLQVFSEPGKNGKRRLILKWQEDSDDETPLKSDQISK